MTYTQFLEALSERAKRFGFHYNHDAIREKETNLCPLCAVCHELTGEEYTNARYLNAAMALKLDARASGIVLAADDERYEPKMRQELLKAVGL